MLRAHATFRAHERMMRSACRVRVASVGACWSTQQRGGSCGRWRSAPAPSGTGHHVRAGVATAACAARGVGARRPRGRAASGAGSGWSAHGRGSGCVRRGHCRVCSAGSRLTRVAAAMWPAVGACGKYQVATLQQNAFSLASSVILFVCAPRVCEDRHARPAHAVALRRARCTGRCELVDAATVCPAPSVACRACPVWHGPPRACRCRHGGVCRAWRRSQSATRGCRQRFAVRRLGVRPWHRVRGGVVTAACARRAAG
jgi:hypothetical protein